MPASLSVSPVTAICQKEYHEGRRTAVESRKGAVAWPVGRRPVSLPRSSNRTCPIKASGFPTDFIARLTAAVQLARVVDAVRRGPRTLSHRGTIGRRALAPCAVERGSAGRGHG